MGSCAVLMKEKGLKVSGGDYRYYPPMSDYLKRANIPCDHLNELPHSDITQSLQKTDLIVVGNVVPRDSSDAKIIENSGVKFTSFPEALGSLVLDDIEVVGIAGTHGKTTTTFLLAQMFENLGEKPGYLIGGVLGDRPSSKLGDGKYFFIESDEYDSAYFKKISKFRLYGLNHLILTSLEFDHADIFQSIEDIKDQFRELLPNLDGKIIACNEYPQIKKLLNEYIDKDTTYYGDIEIKVAQKDHTIFSLQGKEFTTNLVGKHNILNLASCIELARSFSFSDEQIAMAIKDLKMVMRRQEYKGQYNKSTVIDDFAHHPRAVRSTIEVIKQAYPEIPIRVVFDPASATARSDIFQKEFIDSFQDADEIIITSPERKTSVKNHNDLDVVQLKADIETRHSIKTFVANNLQQLLSFINRWSQEESVVLVLSNGVCLGLWESEFIGQLKSND